MEKTRKKYTREFKIEVVRFLTGSNMSIAQAGKDLGVNPNVLRDGRRNFKVITLKLSLELAI